MKLKEIKAMSLIELLVALAITSVIVLATFSLILHQRSEKLKLDRQLSTQFVWSQIRLHFIDRKGCENNLKDLSPAAIESDPNTGYTSEFALTEIKGKNNETLFKVDNASDYTGITGEGKVKLKEAYVRIDYGTEQPPHSKQSFWGTLAVVFQSGDKDIKKTMSNLNLNVEITDTTKFLSCSPWEDLHAYEKTCEGQPGTNPVLIGFRADGSPKCIEAPTASNKVCPNTRNVSKRSGCPHFPEPGTCRGQKTFNTTCFYYQYKNPDDETSCEVEKTSKDCGCTALDDNGDCTESSD